jgi:hypothetical protein
MDRVVELIYKYNSPAGFYTVNPYGPDDVRWVAIGPGESAYFSGRDAAVYFGDQFIDEIVEIHFSVHEAVIPYYGYASRIWDAVVRGHREISGVFTINFKKSGYILSALRHLIERSRGGSSSKSGEAKTTQQPFGRMGRISPQEFTALLRRTKDLSAEAEKLKQQYWGITEARDRESSQIWLEPLGNNPIFSGPRGGFLLWIVFGQPQVSELWGTIRGLAGVEIVGFRQSVEESGKPILEEYTFVARSLAVEKSQKASSSK